MHTYVCRLTIELWRGVPDGIAALFPVLGGCRDSFFSSHILWNRNYNGWYSLRRCAHTLATRHLANSHKNSTPAATVSLPTRWSSVKEHWRFRKMVRMIPFFQSAQPHCRGNIYLSKKKIIFFLLNNLRLSRKSGAQVVSIHLRKYVNQWIPKWKQIWCITTSTASVIHTVSRSSIAMWPIMPSAFTSNWSSTMDQMLLTVAGEGGMGKTRVIKAVELGFELLQWKVLPLHGYITALGRNRYRPTFLSETSPNCPFSYLLQTLSYSVPNVTTPST